VGGGGLVGGLDGWVGLALESETPAQGVWFGSVVWGGVESE